MPTPLRVLILEDTPADAELEIHELRQAGFEPEWVRVETEADYVASLDTAPDIILADYSLPQFDAPRALQRLQEHGLGAPFIVISGTVGEEMVAECMRQGATDYLLKDRLGRLGLAVTHALQEHRARQEQRQAETARREADERLRALFEASPIAIIALSPDDLVLTWNLAAERIYGWRADEVLGKPYPLVPEDQRSEREGFRARVYAGATLPSGRFKRQRKDGALVDVRNAATALKDPAGNIIGHLIFSEDISEEVETERALAVADEHLRALFEASPIAIIALSPDDLVLTWNPAAERIYGWPADEVLGKPYPLVPEDRQEERTGYKALVYSGATLSNERLQRRRKDGSLVDVRNAGTAFRDPAGNINGQIIFSEDISQEAAMERALQESMARTQALVDASPLAITALDTAGNVQSWNPAAERMFGWTESEVLGKPLPFIPAEGEQEYATRRMQVAQGQTIAGLERRLLRKDGTYIDVSISIAPLYDNAGKLTGTTGVIADISQRKRAEEESQRSMARMSALHAIDRAISSSMDLRVSLGVLLDQVMEQLKVDATSVLLRDTNTNMLEYAAGRGFRGRTIEGSRLRLGEGHVGRAALERRTVLIEDINTADPPFLRSELVAEEGFVSYYAVPLIAKGQVNGVLEIFHRTRLDPDPGWLEFLKNLGAQAAIAIDNVMLFEGMQRSNLELASAYDATLEGWVRALDMRDNETEGHSRRVVQNAERLARVMGISDAELVHVRRGALLHDIGKMAIPDEVLHKAGPLTEDEWATMRRHPEDGFRFLSAIPYLRPALDIPYCHHERWDGSGYPRGLKGEDIPFVARLFAPVDIWDALRSDRPYRAAWTEEETRKYIRSLAGKHLDPRVVEAFLSMQQ